MDPDVGVFAQVAVIIVALAASLSVITVGLVKALAPKKRALPADRVDERLEHLQQSVDTIAVEVERIAEAQRFTTKLLAERGESAPVDR
jgi:uncharacterized protein YoxC